MTKSRICGKLGDGQVFVGPDKPDSKHPEPEAKVKKERKPVIKKGLFYLYKEEIGIDPEDPVADHSHLVEIGSYETIAQIQEAYRMALEKGIPENQLKGYKARRLQFAVKQSETKITVK